MKPGRAKVVWFTDGRGNRRVGFVAEEKEKTVHVRTLSVSGKSELVAVVGRARAGISIGPCINTDGRNYAMAAEMRRQEGGEA
jgi:hypothetical protein